MLAIALGLFILAGILRLVADWSATANFRRKSHEEFKKTMEACGRTQQWINEERKKANAWKEQYKK